MAYKKDNGKDLGMIRNIMSKKDKIWSFLCLFVFCLVVSWSYYVIAINADNYNYAIEELHTFNSELFAGNINIGNANCSPRFFANIIMSGLMDMLGVSWAGVAAALIRFNYILYALAFSVLANRVSTKNKYLMGLVVSVAVMGATIPSLGFGLNGANDVFLGTAIPVSLLAISLLVGNNKRWFSAWILLAISALLHIHEGIWGGCVVWFLWVAFCLAEKKLVWKRLKGFPIYASAVLAVVLPSLTSGDVVDNARFVEIYAFIRTPHHLLLSNWGARAIFIASVLVILPVFMLLVQKRKGYSVLFEKTKVYPPLVMIGLWFLLLITEFFITEITPIATLITMYLPKCFKYITYLAIVFYLIIMEGCCERKKYILAIAVLGIVLLPSVKGKVICGGLFLLATYFGLDEMLLNVKKQGLDICFKNLLYCGLAAYVVYIRGRSGWALTAMLFFVVNECVVPLVKHELLASVGAMACLLVSFLCVVDGCIFNIGREGVSYISGTECLKAGVGEEVYELATDFKTVCSGNITFLSDPDDEITGAFQLVSEKNCFASYKNTPSSKRAVIEWYDRILSVRGIGDMDGIGVAKLLSKVELDYVLVRNEQFETLENSGLFECVVKNDVAGVYRLE